MKSSWNVVRTSVALSACLGLLAACQDRGQFQSKTYSKAEVDAWKVKNAPPAANPDPATPTKTPAENDPNKVNPTPAIPRPDGGVTTGAAAPSAPIPVATVPVETPAIPTHLTTPFQGLGATIKNFAENMPANRDSLIAQNRADLIVSKEAAKLVKGISVKALTKDNKHFLSVDAIVFMNSETHYVFLKNAPLAYSEDKIINTFSNPADGLVAIEKTAGKEIVLNPEKFVKISAVCIDPACAEFLLRLDFKVGEGIVPAVFLYKLVNGNCTKLESNLGHAFKTWDEFMKGPEEQFGPPSPPVLAPAAATTTPPPAGVPLAATVPPPSAEAAAIAAAAKAADEDPSWVRSTAPGAIPPAGPAPAIHPVPPNGPAAAAPAPETVTPTAPAAPTAAAKPIDTAGPPGPSQPNLMIPGVATAAQAAAPNTTATPPPAPRTTGDAEEAAAAAVTRFGGP